MDNLHHLRAHIIERDKTNTDSVDFWNTYQEICTVMRRLPLFDEITRRRFAQVYELYTKDILEKSKYMKISGSGIAEDIIRSDKLSSDSME